MNTKKYLNLFLIGCIAVEIISIIILGSVPPVSRDALIHHLSVPELYLKHGGIYQIPAYEYSYYPMNLDLIYMIPLYLGNDIVPKYIHFVFALMTALLIFRYLKKHLNITYGYIGAAFFLSLPVIIKLSITVYVDLGLIFFSTAALLSIFKWIENSFKIKYIVISAICCGLALGTKYNGLIVFFLLTLLVPLIYLRSDSVEKSGYLIKALGYSTLLFTMALIIFSPWMIKNYIWTGNPLYPMYNNLLNFKKSDQKIIETEKTSNVKFNKTDKKEISIQKKKKTGFGSFTVRKLVYKESLWEILLTPVRVFFQGKDNNPKYFDGKLNPLLFFLPIFAMAGLKFDSVNVKVEKKVMFAFTVLFILYVFVKVDMRIRYIAPVIAPLVILSVYGIRHIASFSFPLNSFSLKKGFGWFLLISAVLLCCLNISYGLNQFKLIQPWAYLTHKISRDQYIEKFRPEYSVMKYVNKNLPDSAKIMGVFLGKRSYYCDREIIFNYTSLKTMIKQSDNAIQVALKLKEKNITHFIIKHDFFNAWKNKGLSESESHRFGNLFKNQCKFIYFKNGYGLYMLVTKDDLDEP